MSEQNFNESLSEELERAFSCRIEELTLFENTIFLATTNEDNLGKCRKMLIVMVYAYFEGFCKDALTIYIDYINRLQVMTKDVTNGIAASSIEADYALLLNSNHKPEPLRGKLLDQDGILHQFARRKEFWGKYSQLLNKKVELSDKLIDAESNLKSDVLKKLLYKLDLDYTKVDDFQSELNHLIGIRNSVAHGNLTRGILKDTYDNYKTTATHLMKEIKELITSSYVNRIFLIQSL